MTEITDLSTTDSSNTSISGESLDGAIANMGRMDNTLQATMGMLARSIRTGVMRIIDAADATKRIAFDLSGLPTGTTRTWTAPYYSGTLGLVSDIRGQIYGLTLSNNVTDPTNDIDIAAGAAVDSTGVVSMLLASSLTKRLDAAWAVGSGNGWLDTGAVANGTYHAFLIRRPDTGVVDSLASTSATSPTLPTNYTQFRRIGSIVRFAGSIKPFVQYGDYFYWKDPSQDKTGALGTTAAILVPLLVPADIRPVALISGFINESAAANTIVYISSTDQTDAVPSATYYTAQALSNVYNGAFNIQVRADSSRNIRVRGGTTTVAPTINTTGWIDNR